MIDLTPLDVRKKRGDFKKSLRGYDPLEVDAFIELVAERMEELVKANLTLEERASRLGEQVVSLGGRERAVNQALVTAQQLREEIKEQAQREAEQIRADAEREANRLKSDTERDTTQLQEDTERAVAQMVREAQEEASNLREEALQEATAMHEEARTVSETLRSDAEKAAATLRAEAEEAAARLRGEAERAAEALRTAAATETEAAVTTAQRLLDERRDALAEVEAQRLRFLDAYRQLLQRQIDLVQVEENRSPLEEVAVDLDLRGGRLGTLGAGRLDAEAEAAAAAALFDAEAPEPGSSPDPVRNGSHGEDADWSAALDAEPVPVEGLAPSDEDEMDHEATILPAPDSDIHV